VLVGRVSCIDRSPGSPPVNGNWDRAHTPPDRSLGAPNEPRSSTTLSAGPSKSISRLPAAGDPHDVGAFAIGSAASQLPVPRLDEAQETRESGARTLAGLLHQFDGIEESQNRSMLAPRCEGVRRSRRNRVHVLESRDRRLAFGDETGEDQAAAARMSLACHRGPRQ